MFVPFFIAFCLFLEPTGIAIASPQPVTVWEYLQNEQATGRLDRETALLYQVYAIFEPERLPADLKALLDSSRGNLEGTLILREVRQHWNEWSPEFRNQVAPYFLIQPGKMNLPERNVPPRKNGDSLSKSLLQGNHRMAHWAQTANFNFEWGDNIDWTSAAPCKVPFTDSSVGSGTCPPVPDLVKRWAEYFEASWDQEIGTMGYAPPAYTATGLIDVFIANTGCGNPWCALSPEYLGLTVTYCSPAFSCGNAGEIAAYILVNRNSQSDVTAAHEFFHVLQFAYDADDKWYTLDNWWLEATATWMEDQVFDSTNSYYGNIRPWVRYPETSLRSIDRSRAYGSSLFVFYLAETFGERIIREIWEDPPLNSVDGMQTIDVVLRNKYHSDLNAAFTEFTARNAVMDYEEGAGYGTMALLKRQTDYPVISSISAPTAPEQLGANYLLFLPTDGTEHNLTLTFDGQDDILWGAMVVKLIKDGGYEAVEMTLSSGDESGCLSLSGFGSFYSGLYLIPSVLADSSFPIAGSSYTYSATLQGECQTSLGQESPPPRTGSDTASDKRCLIATAAYGSYEAPYVRLLREFRNRYLMPHPLGRWMVSAYYRCSPPVADFIALHPFAAALTRIALLPLIALAALLVS
jgi:hypothetical protein